MKPIKTNRFPWICGNEPDMKIVAVLIDTELEAEYFHPYGDPECHYCQRMKGYHDKGCLLEKIEHSFETEEK